MPDTTATLSRLAQLNSDLQAFVSIRGRERVPAVTDLRESFLAALQDLKGQLENHRHIGTNPVLKRDYELRIGTLEQRLHEISANWSEQTIAENYAGYLRATKWLHASTHALLVWLEHEIAAIR